MRYIELTERNLSPTARLTADIIDNAGVAVIPTETQYGLSSLLNESVYRINRIKGRPEKQPQIVLIKFEWVEKWIRGRYIDFVEALWPGPYSIVIPSRLENPFDSEHICFRVSPHPFVNRVLDYLGQPITSTSANQTGRSPLLFEKELKEAFQEEVDLIVHDRRDRPYSGVRLAPASTMIDATSFPDKIRILRAGASDLRHLDRVFPGLKVEYA